MQRGRCWTITKQFTFDTYDDDLKELHGVHPECHSFLAKRMKWDADVLKSGARSTFQIVRLLNSIPPNRHELLYFGDKLAPDIYIMFLRMHLVVQ